MVSRPLPDGMLDHNTFEEGLSSGLLLALRPVGISVRVPVVPDRCNLMMLDAHARCFVLKGWTSLGRRNMIKQATILAFAAAFAVCLGAGGATAQGVPNYAALIAAPDRSDADRATYKRRDPLKLLEFTGVRTGMKVLDMGAGGGYSTELMARAVGPTGMVYGQNPADQGQRGKDAFTARLEKPAGKNIVRATQPFDDPLPAGVTGLDLITYLFFYHDTAYMQVDRTQMNRKMFAALKPGGFLIIADHAAKAGQGTSVARTLHRIEEGVVKSEVEAAGFKFVSEGGFWRHPEDTFDFTTQPPTKPADEFVLKFQKPQ
jgi:predicted methyltransferase